LHSKTHLCSLVAYIVLFTVAPEIDRKHDKETILKVGTTTLLKIPFVANPPPTVRWFFNGKDIPPGDKRFEADCCDHVTSLKMKNVRRSDTGIYTVDLQNVLGTDNTDIEVVVAGKISHHHHRQHHHRRRHHHHHHHRHV